MSEIDTSAVEAHQKRRPGRPRRVHAPVDTSDVPAHIIAAVPESCGKSLRKRLTWTGELEETIKLMLGIGPASAAPGIYFLFSDAGEVVYVGQSKNVASRMRGHAGKEFREIKMLRVESPSSRDRLEILFIRLFRPKYNVAYN